MYRDVGYNFNKRKKYIYEILKKFFIIIIISIIFIVNCITVFAQQVSDNVIKVGFPIQKGLSYINEKGEYAGYLVDYLNYIKLYTNWDIEYVQVEGDINKQLSTLINMLENGEIDMLGTMNRTSDLESMFLYPTYNYGTAYTVLAVKEDSQKFISEDFEHWDNIKVATCPSFERRMELLKQYASVVGFEYETIEYETYSKALNAVYSGEADAIIQVDISIQDELRAIAQFSPTPYYFALYKGNTHLIKSLNMAIDNINQVFPYLKSQLYTKYFGNNNDFYISENDKECIKNLGKLKVLLFDGNAPFQYVKDGKPTGCALNYIDKFSKQTGMQYELITVSTYEEAEKLIKNGEVDLIACIPINYKFATIDGIQFSLPYLFSNSILVYSDELTDIKQKDTYEFHTNAEKALEEVKNDSTHTPIVDAYSLDYYKQKKEIFDNVYADWETTESLAYTVAVNGNMPQELISALNRFAASFDESDRQDLIYMYIYDDVEYSFGEIIYVYRYIIIAVLLILFSISRQIILDSKNKKSIKKILETENELSYISCYDTLTGAYNERQFRILFSKDCQNNVPKSLIALNIRDFKYINEVFSVTIADKFLCRIKDILDNMTSDDEYFCRQSADVFYLAFNESTENQISLRINKIHECIQKEADKLLEGYQILMYWGVVFTGNSPEKYSVSSNFSYMLLALSQAKKKNTADICFYNDELHKLEQNRHYIESHMHSALEQCEFKLYLQPKKNLKTGNFDCAEALVRWQTNDGKMIYPDQFIPLFEENGFCIKLDLYMVEMVCKQLRNWIDMGLKPISISVNQTKLLFLEPKYVEKLCTIIQKYNIEAKMITLEILEGLALEDIDYLNKCISKLKSAGFRISLDDFGSGYSSLNILGDLDIDELKVDREFLRDISKKSGYHKKCIVLEQIIQLAKKIGVDTVAEGVESLEDEEIIKNWKYDYGQGYYYSKPIPAEEFLEKFIKK